MFRTTVLLSLTCVLATDAPAQLRVVNTASRQIGMPAGGALATVYAPGLHALPGLYVADPSLPLPHVLDGLEVLVNNSPAPLLAIYIPAAGDTAPAHIDFQVPMERNYTAKLGLVDPGTLMIHVTGIGTASDPPLTQLPRPGGGGFFSTGNGYASAQHASDNSFVTADNPARAGETIIVFADDFYQVWPPPPLGIPVPPQMTFQYDASLPNIASNFVFGFMYLYLQDYPIPTSGMPSQNDNSNPSSLPLQILSRGLVANQIGVEEIQFVVPSYQLHGDWALFFNTCNYTGGKSCDGFNPRSSTYVLLPVR